MTPAEISALLREVPPVGIIPIAHYVIPDYDAMARVIHKRVVEPYDLLCRAVNESAEPCLATCDAEAHDEGCPRINAEAWLRNRQAEIERLRGRMTTLEEALGSIAQNTCCDSCHEAALVARAALVREVKK
jgi:hypothetical protein